jgi:hypothetical protein
MPKDIDNLDRSFTSKLQIKSKLKSLELLPLYSDNPKIPYLIKIIGFVPMILTILCATIIVRIIFWYFEK